MQLHYKSTWNKTKSIILCLHLKPKYLHLDLWSFFIEYKRKTPEHLFCVHLQYFFNHLLAALSIFFCDILYIYFNTFFLVSFIFLWTWFICTNYSKAKLSMFTCFPGDITVLAANFSSWSCTQDYFWSATHTHTHSPKSEPTRAHRLKLHYSIPHAQILLFREKGTNFTGTSECTLPFYRCIVLTL